MILNPSFDQEYCQTFGFNSDTGFLIDLIIKLPTWAKRHTTDNGDYFFIDYGKITLELPAVFKSKSKITKLIKPVIDSGIVNSIKVGRSLYLKASPELVYFWKLKKDRQPESNRSKNRTFYNWNDYVLKMKRIVLNLEPISTPAISSPSISTPVSEYVNRSKKEPKKSNGKQQPKKDTTEELKLTETKKPKGEPKGLKTWNAYASAYQRRYGMEPLRNASVNSMLCKLVDYVGADKAPLVASYFVQLNKSFYTNSHHPVKLLLADYQSIYNQMINNTDQTSNDTRTLERRSSMAQSVENLKQKISRGEL